MEIEFYLIRHARTAGNLEHRYVGRTDEGLSPQGIMEAKKLGSKFREDFAEEYGRMPVQNLTKNTAVSLCQPSGDIRIDYLFSSPMRRCLETANLIFPERIPSIINDLRECDFGSFEYMNYRELSGNKDYQAFIDSGGKTAFPGGEEPDAFRSRIVKAFDQIVKSILEQEKSATSRAAIVCHGGSIMSILDKYSVPHRDYFDWMMPGASFYLTKLDTGEWSWGLACMHETRLYDA